MYNSSMLNRVAAEIDYLVIGHITRDVLPNGESTWGGTAAYAGLTARNLGRRAAVLTVFNPHEPLGALEELPIAGAEDEDSTTFENEYRTDIRAQRVFSQAGRIHPYMLPETWRTSSIVHFGPVLDEIDPDLLRLFPESLRILTPQGWMRSVGPQGEVSQSEWIEARFFLGQADVVVISREDAGNDERLIAEYAEASRLLVVTEGTAGSRLFEHGRETRIPAEIATAVDTTGAGDIFAAGFAVYLQRTGDPEAAARLGAHLAAISVTRNHLEGVPTRAECMDALIEFEPELSI